MPVSGLWSRGTIVAVVVGLVTFRVSGGLASDEAPTVPLSDRVSVEIHEGLADSRSWEFELPAATERYDLPAFGMVCTPRKYTRNGVLDTRPHPFVVSATARIALPAGEHRLLLRSKNAARLLVDGKPIAETTFLDPNASGHEPVPESAGKADNEVAPLPPGHQENAAMFSADGEAHEFRLVAIVGGSKLRPEVGEVCVAVASGSGQPRLLSPGRMAPLTRENWWEYATRCYEQQRQRDAQARRAAAADAAQFWGRRHAIARRELAAQAGVVPPRVNRAGAVHNPIDQFVLSRLDEAGVPPAPLSDDFAFLRRVTLDTVGVIPSPAEIADFVADSSSGRRSRVIARLLDDCRWADNWVGYWQDVLAENPGILKPTLNNTGPFRWWIHESFSDNKPFDQFVTELIRMDGGQWSGGPAGFAMATQNDAPMAAKAHVLAKAFLGVELQCARCHDAPFHPYKQQELFSLAAMLAREPQKVPATSSVILAERTRRPLIEVTLEPGVPVAPAWPFAELAPAELPEDYLHAADDPRERLAAIVTSPRNQRFAEVIVNRLWHRYLGAGLVEPVDDWHNAQSSHPELLEYLAREFVQHGYDLKHAARLIFESHTYQRAVTPEEQPANGAVSSRLFASPMRRRMSAEQVVDSLFAAASKEFRSEELTMDPEGRRPVMEMQNLGIPSRAWEFTSLSNERDRPALSLPAAQSVVDVLTSFGWRESRQNPLTVREEVATPAQPMILANGVVGARITCLSDDSALTELALREQTLESLISAIFRQVLSRDPADHERRQFADLLREGYERRIVAGEKNSAARRPRLSTAVSWSNHLSPEATRIKMELERAARAGDAPTRRLEPEWREKLEDVVWALVNTPEFVFVP